MVLGSVHEALEGGAKVSRARAMAPGGVLLRLGRVPVTQVCLFADQVPWNVAGSRTLHVQDQIARVSSHLNRRISNKECPMTKWTSRDQIPGASRLRSLSAVGQWLVYKCY